MSAMENHWAAKHLLALPGASRVRTALRYPSRFNTRCGRRGGHHEDTMAQVSEVKVPDIGNYTNVPVIEVLVKPGDAVTKDQGLVTLESDKATMEVPSTIAGIIKELKVKLGDEVSEGTVIAIVESEGAGADEKADAPKAA